MKKMMIPLLLLIAAGCSNETPEQPIRKGYLVQAEEVRTVNSEMLKSFLITQEEYRQFAEFLQNDVRLIRVTYTTEYPKGTAINVSGALLISENYDADFPTVVYNHGTYADRESAPSTDIAGLSSLDAVLGIVIASAFNCALLLPDYIGYGESKSTAHPYVHVESLGQTGLDFLRAFREYMASPDVDRPVSDRVFITGYSEGGTAALAVHKAIDDHPEEGLTVAGNVAGSGVYDMVAACKAFVDNPNPLEPQMLSSYLLVLGMYKTDFGYSKDYADIFSEEDNDSLQSIDYDLTYFRSVTENLQLNNIAAQLFQPAFIDGVRNETDTEFIRISQQNSLVDFAPKDSLILVYGAADNWVHPVNSVNAYDKMLEKGCKVGSRVHSAGDHYTTIPLYMSVLLEWLSKLVIND